VNFQGIGGRDCLRKGSEHSIPGAPICATMNRCRASISKISDAAPPKPTAPPSSVSFTTADSAAPWHRPMLISLY